MGPNIRGRFNLLNVTGICCFFYRIMDRKLLANILTLLAALHPYRSRLGDQADMQAIFLATAYSLSL